MTTATPTVPFVPEPIDRLRDRYPEALRDTYDLEAVQLRTQPPPGSLRKHVFDSEDGLRLTVSVENHGGLRGDHLHVSASIHHGSKLYAELMAVARRAGGQAVEDALIAAGEARFRELSGDEEPLELIGLTPKAGIPHWVRGLGVTV